MGVAGGGQKPTLTAAHSVTTPAHAGIRGGVAKWAKRERPEDERSNRGDKQHNRYTPKPHCGSPVLTRNHGRGRRVGLEG